MTTFDLLRPGPEPVYWLPTCAKSRRSQPAMSLRGIVSSLSLEPISNVVAAGTLSRSIALYGSFGEGECLGVIDLASSKGARDIGGAGVTQTVWSPCGRYLYIAERKSDGIVCYDIRDLGECVSWLINRKASTHQRLAFDVKVDWTSEGHQIQAGGIDGAVRIWKSPHQLEGPMKPNVQWQADKGW